MAWRTSGAGSEDLHMLTSPYPDTKVLFIEVGSGKPDAYNNLVEKRQLPLPLGQLARC